MKDPDNLWSVKMSSTGSNIKSDLNEGKPLLSQTYKRYGGSGTAQTPSSLPRSGSDSVLSRPSVNNIRINRQSSVTSENVDQAQIPENKLLSAEFESLDYDTCENVPYQRTERAQSFSGVIKRQLARWFVMLLIGVLTALTACFIDICIDKVATFKFWLVKNSVDNCATSGCLYKSLLIWVGFNACAVLIASCLVVFGEPCAAGSGIPQIKCFLNGVKIPHVVRVKTLFCKVLGVIFSVIGGLCVGKEGPMIHSGAVIAAGISQGRSTSFRLDFKIFEYFRTDTEKRDFVSGGAAAGVAAAFGAPVGGVLFSLEEGASFWNQSLTWRIFFASLVSTFTLNVVFSYYNKHPWELSYPGLINFGQFGGSLDWHGEEIPIFLLMGAIGGLSGALFNAINTKLTIFRMKYVHRAIHKIIEAMIVAMITANLFFLLIYVQSDCQPLGKDPTDVPMQFFCYDGQYNAMGAILLQVPEASVKSLFHDPDGAFRPETLAMFFVAYFLMSCWTYGLSVSSGLFIPSLLTGAAWGRICGALLSFMFPNTTWSPGKYALIGAAAQLGGTVRMTISLTVILIEATKNISFGLPLMMVLMVAKWVGDFFNEGIYDIHIQLQGVPLLVWDPPPITSNILAMEFMSHPVVTLRTVEKVGRIIDILSRERHDGFPVVQDFDPDGRDVGTFGTFKGLILRTQLIVLLKNKVFSEPGQELFCRKTLSSEDFRETYPRFPFISQIHISAHERTCVIDLRPYMNPAPFMVLHTTSLPRIFRLFRGLGLRHLCVVNHHNEVVGIVTRKDLARYRVWNHGGKMGVDELQVSHG